MNGAVDDAEAVTKGDLRYLADSLVETMRKGFEGVHARQDKTNGRVNLAEVELGRHDERLKSMAKEVFNRRSTDRRGHESSDTSGEQRPITRRDVYVAAAGVGASVAVVKLLSWLGPIVKAAGN